MIARAGRFENSYDVWDGESSIGHREALEQNAFAHTRIAGASAHANLTTNVPSTTALPDQYSGFGCVAFGVTIIGRPAKSGAALASASRTGSFRRVR